MSTNQVWPAPQVSGTGGCPSCDWIKFGPVPGLISIVIAPGFSTAVCGFVTCTGPIVCGGGLTRQEAPQIALKLVGGSYDSTKKYSDGLTGCADTISSLVWSGIDGATMDVWSDYRAGLWTGMMQIEIYAEYTLNTVPTPCVPGAGCIGCGIDHTTSVSAAVVAATDGAQYQVNISTGPGYNTGTAGHCPWGGTLLKTITVYDDGTVTIT